MTHKTYKEQALTPAAELDLDVDLDVAEPADVLYIAGWNTPGYLPESGPMIFNNETDAIRYLSNTIDRFWDDDYDASPTREDRSALRCIERRRAADEKWLDVFSNLPYETAPFNITNNDRSLTFWVTIVPKPNLPYNTEGN